MKKVKWKNVKNVFLSLLVMALWGSLFPCIKIGYEAFEIKGTDIPSILMFAGTRFTLCGLIICIVAIVKKDKIHSMQGNSLSAELIVLFPNLIKHLLSSLFVQFKVFLLHCLQSLYNELGSIP